MLFLCLRFGFWKPLCALIFVPLPLIFIYLFTCRKLPFKLTPSTLAIFSSRDCGCCLQPWPVVKIKQHAKYVGQRSFLFTTYSADRQISRSTEPITFSGPPKYSELNPYTYNNQKCPNLQPYHPYGYRPFILQYHQHCIPTFLQSQVGWLTKTGCFSTAVSALSSNQYCDEVTGRALAHKICTKM